MKLSIIGLGQCGCNITDELYGVNRYANSIFHRHLEIVTDAFAINTDETDLGGFRNIPKDNNHRILIGSIATFGHGVGKMNTEAAEIIKSSNLVVADTILQSRKFHESDAIIAVASAGGGTGSGTIGWLLRTLKERVDKPIYAIIVLPFAFEERGDVSYAVMNAATCINTVSRYADAVFLVDNERFRKAGNNLSAELKEINQSIAWSFYDLCCAGEEKIQKYVGSKVLDAGDIKHSLSGITSIGRAELDLPLLRLRRNDYREAIKIQSLVLGALRQSKGSSSLSVDIADARKILALVSAPKDTISVGIMEEISNSLQTESPKAVIRMGDYPRRGKEVSVTLIASELTNVPRLARLFLQAEELFRKKEQIAQETEAQIRQLHMLSSKLPTLD